MQCTFTEVTGLVELDKIIRNEDKKAKLLLLSNGVIGLVFLIGNAIGLFFANILASFIWGILFPIACIFIARVFKLRGMPDKT